MIRNQIATLCQTPLTFPVEPHLIQGGLGVRDFTAHPIQPSCCSSYHSILDWRLGKRRRELKSFGSQYFSHPISTLNLPINYC